MDGISKGTRFTFFFNVRDHPSKELGGWNEILAIFAKFLYSVHADIVGGSEKVQKIADVTYACSLKQTHCKDILNIQNAL